MSNFIYFLGIKKAHTIILLSKHGWLDYISNSKISGIRQLRDVICKLYGVVFCEIEMAKGHVFSGQKGCHQSAMSTRGSILGQKVSEEKRMFLTM